MFDEKKKGGRENQMEGTSERARESERERESESERRKGKRVGDLVHYSPIIAAD